jgi:RNA polymerase sigma factor (sigma-70 family)
MERNDEQGDVIDRQFWQERPTDARSKVLSDWDGLVTHAARKAANRFPSNTIEEEDLFQVAALGLFDAVEKFDPGQGTPFPAYARWRITGAIRDYLREVDPVPTRTRRAVSKLEKAIGELGATLDRDPTPAEAAEHLGWTLERVHEIRKRAEWHSAPIQEWDWETRENPESLSLRYETRKKLRRAFERLATQKRTVLRGLYLEERLGRQVAEEIGVTQGRVSQIKSEALAEMKGLMEDSEWNWS